MHQICNSTILSTNKKYIKRQVMDDIERIITSYNKTRWIKRISSTICCQGNCKKKFRAANVYIANEEQHKNMVFQLKETKFRQRFALRFQVKTQNLFFVHLLLSVITCHLHFAQIDAVESNHFHWQQQQLQQSRSNTSIYVHNHPYHRSGIVVNKQATIDEKCNNNNRSIYNVRNHNHSPKTLSPRRHRASHHHFNRRPSFYQSLETIPKQNKRAQIQQRQQQKQNTVPRKHVNIPEKATVSKPHSKHLTTLSLLNNGYHTKPIPRSSLSPTLMNEYGTYSDMTPLPPLQILTIGNVNATVGRNAQLNCVINRPGQYKVAWLKMDNNSEPTLLTLGLNSLVTEDEGKYKVTHNERQWELHINRVQVQDRGRYMCQINAKIMTSQIGYLDVHEPPVINEELTSSDTTVDELQKASLRCASSGYPTPSISWRRENGKSLNLGLYGGKKFAANTWEGEYLNISQVTRDDMGAYLCIASNGIQPSVSRRIVLQINFRPKIRVHNQLVSAYLGSDVELECRIEASPKPEVFWLTGTGQKLEELMEQWEQRQQQLGLLVESKINDDLPKSTLNRAKFSSNNQFIRANVNGQLPLHTNPHAQFKRKKYQFEEENDGYRTVMRLTIRQLESADFGSYKCVAKNSLGEKEGLVRLYEIPVPTLPPTTTVSPPTTMASSRSKEYASKNKQNSSMTSDEWAKSVTNGQSGANSNRSLRENQKQTNFPEFEDDEDEEADYSYLERKYKNIGRTKKKSGASARHYYSLKTMFLLFGLYVFNFFLFCCF